MVLLQAVCDSYFFFVVGIISVICACLKILYGLYRYYAIYFTESPVDYKKFGKWALVTGSTDGIGKCIARELAAHGVDLILVSRSPEKLQRVADEIQSEFNVEIETFAFDFTQSDDAPDGMMTSSVYNITSNRFGNHEIGILVNNVGMSVPGMPDTFLQLTDDRGSMTSDLVSCNVTSMAKMTQLILPQMLNRRRGLVINMSSALARVICPYSALYGSTKKFNDVFSKATSNEYEGNGIVIQCIQPGLVDTNMTSQVTKDGGSWDAPTASTFARHAMMTVGKAEMNHGYWLHAIQFWIMSRVPERMLALGFKRYMKDVKKRTEVLSK